MQAVIFQIDSMSSFDKKNSLLNSLESSENVKLTANFNSTIYLNVILF